MIRGATDVHANARAARRRVVVFTLVIRYKCERLSEKHKFSFSVIQVKTYEHRMGYRSLCSASMDASWDCLFVQEADKSTRPLRPWRSTGKVKLSANPEVEDDSCWELKIQRRSDNVMWKYTATTTLDEIWEFNVVKIANEIFFFLQSDSLLRIKKFYQLNQLDPINVMTWKLKCFTHFQLTARSWYLICKTHNLLKFGGKRIYEFFTFFLLSRLCEIGKYFLIFSLVGKVSGETVGIQKCFVVMRTRSRRVECLHDSTWFFTSSRLRFVCSGISMSFTRWQLVDMSMIIFYEWTSDDQYELTKVEHVV